MALRKEEYHGAQHLRRIEADAQPAVVPHTSDESTCLSRVIKVRPVDERSVEAVVHEVAEPEDMIRGAKQNGKEAAGCFVDTRIRVKIAVERLMREVPEGIAQHDARDERDHQDRSHPKKKRQE